MNIKIARLKKGKPEIFLIEVNENNSIIVKRKLEQEYKKVLRLLNKFKDDEVIKSLSKPRNKYIQENLNGLVDIKNQIKRAVSQINTLFN